MPHRAAEPRPPVRDDSFFGLVQRTCRSHRHRGRGRSGDPLAAHRLRSAVSGRLELEMSTDNSGSGDPIRGCSAGTTVQAAFDLPPGKVWLSMRLTSFGARPFALVASLGQPNVVGVLRSLMPAVKNVRALGKRCIEGRVVDRFAVRTTRGEIIVRLRRSFASPEVTQQSREFLPCGSTTSIVSVARCGTLSSITHRTSLSGRRSKVIVNQSSWFRESGLPVTVFDPLRPTSPRCGARSRARHSDSTGGHGPHVGRIVLTWR